MIPFNKPYYTGKELSDISKAIKSKVLAGENYFTVKCEELLEKKYNFKKVFLTNSCTTALEIAAVLCDIKNGDEVIIPSFTYVSTANAFALRGAEIVFCDSKKDHPQLDVSQIDKLITKKTKAIVVVHYGGIACEMDEIMAVAAKYNILVVEDAAHCIGVDFNNRALGSIGNIGCFSFHETKNIHCGEGGFIAVNDTSMITRAEKIKSKGTNRSAFIRGEVNKYEWVDLGFSATPNGLSAAFLFSQLHKIESVEKKRKKIWDAYYKKLSVLEKKNILLPYTDESISNNAHLFYLVCNATNERNELIAFLKKNGIQAVFHYQSLHSSPYFKNKYKGMPLVNADRYSDCLVRLPLFYDLSTRELNYICSKVIEFYSKKN